MLHGKYKKPSAILKAVLRFPYTRLVPIPSDKAYKLTSLSKYKSKQNYWPPGQVLFYLSMIIRGVFL